MDLPLYPAPSAGIVDFLRLWAVYYAGLLAIYFTFCSGFHWLNKRHPERRIQMRPAKNQIRMEIRASVLALLWISMYVAGGVFVQAKGWALIPLELSWWSVLVTFAISTVLHDAWFYWGHRMMHTKWFYRFHDHHHKSLVPTPWSNNSDGFVGSFVEQSYFLFLPFVLPIPPLVLIAHNVVDQIKGIGGHAGHEYFAGPSSRKPWPGVCTTFHDQHHGHFNYNYANTFSFWDRWMGTIHPSYDSVVKQFEVPLGAMPLGRQQMPASTGQPVPSDRAEAGRGRAD